MSKTKKNVEKMIWKCPYCKNDMDISDICDDGYDPSIIKVNNDIWHTACYKEYSYKNELKKIDHKIETYISKTKKVFEDGKIYIEAVKDDRTLLTDWLLEVYDEDSFDIRLYTILDSANKGQYKEYSVHMEYDILLAMWKKQFPKLQIRWIEDSKKGNIRKGTNRVLYDFAIIASKYEDYLDWLENLPVEEEIKRKMKEWQSMPKISHLSNQSKEKSFNELYCDVNGKQ